MDNSSLLVHRKQRSHSKFVKPGTYIIIKGKRQNLPWWDIWLKKEKLLMVSRSIIFMIRLPLISIRDNKAIIYRTIMICHLILTLNHITSPQEEWVYYNLIGHPQSLIIIKQIIFNKALRSDLPRIIRKLSKRLKLQLR